MPLRDLADLERRIRRLEMGADQSRHKLVVPERTVSVAPPLGAGDVPYVDLSTNQQVGGVKSFDDIPILPATNPTSDNQAARKAYVDNRVHLIDLPLGVWIPQGVASFIGYGFGSGWILFDTGTSILDTTLPIIYPSRSLRFSALVTGDAGLASITLEARQLAVGAEYPATPFAASLMSIAINTANKFVRATSGILNTSAYLEGDSIALRLYRNTGDANTGNIVILETHLEVI